MVINYKRLNDNTEDDSYDIPDKTELINKIQKAKIFSKFDCKSGFWQIKMHPEAIEWTAFTCPLGHYEWLVMPFGLKNAPSVFQRKMDSIFTECTDYTCVYIDDVLVFSKTRNEHIKHLKVVLEKFLHHGIIISKKKAELFKENISYLGVEIGKGRIKLQEHITKKLIADFPDKIEETKKLQAFLGLLNYARPFIKDLGKMVGPLYSKTGLKGQKYFNSEDIKLVKHIKERVKEIPDLKMPLEADYLIIETDGCETGWGAILKRKPHKYDTKESEEICRYASGNFRTQITALEAEVTAVIKGLDNFRLFVINKKETLIRTDCEAIEKFYKRKNDKKINQRRWLEFVDRLVNSNYKIIIEHIKGKNNELADRLSRLILQEPQDDKL